ncbi:MAG: cobyric acid synthase [bacterium]|nr:cobyric acid synthase [bacterium]
MAGSEAGGVIMVQGTSSHAGKSILVAALCRVFAQEGLSVAPFKAQNMSLNSFATPDGGEIGRSQAVQAAAAMTSPRVEMNPVLLKPEGDRRSQVVVMGRPQAVASPREYHRLQASLWPKVTAALDSLRSEHDVVVIEGAGSPAEINLKNQDIVNMRVALHATAPVLLVGDIDRGGVFAQLVGTMELLDREERARVKGLVINKFRGDPSLLDSGLDFLGVRTGVPVVGVLPYFADIRIPEEDSLGLAGGADDQDGTAVDVAVIRLPHIANFDDFDPLRHRPGVRLRYVSRPADFGDPDLVVIPGSKTTISDLDWLRGQDLDTRILAARREGTPVIGICAGYQMLGGRLFDPHRVESSRSEAEGLGLLATSTTFSRDKATYQTTVRVTADRGLLSGCRDTEATAYEIHMGVTTGQVLPLPFIIESRSSVRVDLPEGAMDGEGLTLGTYLHGLFHNPQIRTSILECAARRRGLVLPDSGPQLDQNAEYDKLAAWARANLDMTYIRRIAGLPG